MQVVNILKDLQAEMVNSPCFVNEMVILKSVISMMLKVYLWDTLPPTSLIWCVKFVCIEKDVHVIFLICFEEMRSKLQNKEKFEMEEMFHIWRDDLNNKLAEAHPLHEPNNLKEANVDDVPDEGPSPLDIAEQR